MSMEDLKKAFEIISKRTDADFSGSKSEELVCLAEKALALKFPPTYREFLKSFGAGGVCGIEIYGIVNEDFKNSGIPDAIWLTLKYRKDWQLPKNLVIIYDYGDGLYCCIDNSKASTMQECPIVVWETGLPVDKLEIVANDFGEFLLNILLQAEAAKDED